MENTQKPERNYALDILRAVAAIYIIGFWHNVDYVDLDFLKTPFTKSWAIIALGVFFIVSSYLLTNQQREVIASRPEGKERKKIIHQFYLKRVLRIYPLYAIAVLLFFWMEIGRWSIPHLVTSLTLIAAIIDKSPLTLWFINVIFLYYLALPFFLFYMRTNSKIVVSGIIFFILLFVIHRLTPLIDERIYVYLPSMIFGVLLGKNEIVQTIFNGKVVVLASFFCLLITFSFIHMNVVLVENVSFILPLLAFPCLLFLSQGLASYKKLRILWIWLGYASFSAYLFHRVFYTFIYEAIEIQASTSVQLALLMFTITLIVMIVSFGIQHFYDLCVKGFQNRSKKIVMT